MAPFWRFQVEFNMQHNQQAPYKEGTMEHRNSSNTA